MEARAAELHAENASIKLFVADRDASESKLKRVTHSPDIVQKS